MQTRGAREDALTVSAEQQVSLRKDAMNNRRRILEAAQALFATKGLSPGLNDVAHHAGVGVATVYRRFPTKAELLEQVYAELLEHYVARLESALLIEDAWVAMQSALVTMCEMCASDRGLREMAYGNSGAAFCTARVRERLVIIATTIVERARDQGCVRHDLSHNDILMFGMIAGSVSDVAGAVASDLWRRYVALTLDGVRSHAVHTTLPTRPFADANCIPLSKGYESPSAHRSREIRTETPL